jgi:cell wall-associated NlpC family hydrolase
VRRVAGHGRIAVGALAALVLIGIGLIVATGGSGDAVRAVRSAAPGAGGGQEVNLDPAAIAKSRAKASASDSAPAGGSHAQIVVAVPPGSASEEPAPSPGSNSRAPSDAQVQRDLDQFRKYLATIPPTTGQRASVISTGEAAAPFDAPQTVIDVVQAANQIALTPYKWGGGHGAWRDKGYDCSGSVSFALAAAGLLNQPLDSTRFESYGSPGPGRWITIYANATHAWMTVAGLRYDTGGLSSGTRWQATMRSTAGFVARHPPGL